MTSFKLFSTTLLPCLCFILVLVTSRFLQFSEMIGFHGKLMGKGENGFNARLKGFHV